MEVASRDAVERLLEKGQMVVGTWISVRHMGAVPKGAIVRAEFYLKEISGRKLTFDVSVYDPKEKIAEGRNELLIVSADKFMERVKRKF